MINEKLSILFALILLIGCCCITNKLCRFIRVPLKVWFLILIWHLFFSIYHLIKSDSSIDASTYYKNAANLLEYGSGYDLYGSLGTRIITYVNVALQYIGLDYFGATIFFSFFGFIGCLLYYKSILNVVEASLLERYKWGPLLFVLTPSLHYYTSKIGKDGIAFLSVSLLTYSLSELKRRDVILLLTPLVMYIARPHIASVLAVSILFHYIILLFDKQKVNMFIFLYLLLVAIYPLYNMSGTISIQDTASVIEHKANKMKNRIYVSENQGSNVNYKQLNIAEKFFGVLFRPMPFERKEMRFLLASIENAVFLSLFLATLFLSFSRNSCLKFVQIGPLLLFSFSVWSFLVITYVNMGLSMRQKWQVLPVLIVLSFSKIPHIELPKFNKKTKLKKKVG